jgi:hypothetical protein
VIYEIDEGEKTIMCTACSIAETCTDPDDASGVHSGLAGWVVREVCRRSGA